MPTITTIQSLMNVIHQYFKLVTIKPYLVPMFDYFSRFRGKAAQQTYILLRVLRLPKNVLMGFVEYEESSQTPIIESIDHLERTQDALVRSLSQLIDENDEGIDELLEMVSELEVETKQVNRNSLLLEDY
ncbi:hypothetical protein K7432_004245 [Basidiobolus ranarum]|uniref:Uncharacterized protein n=1 Tax=Basidiobolus ranarum TaxID=34480 RepID=A0ABR2WYH0_9FUNG